MHHPHASFGRLCNNWVESHYGLWLAGLRSFIDPEEPLAERNCFRVGDSLIWNNILTPLTGTRLVDVACHSKLCGGSTQRWSFQLNTNQWLEPVYDIFLWVIYSMTCSTLQNHDQRKMVHHTRTSHDKHVPVEYQQRILTAGAKQPTVETRPMDTCSWIFVSPESSDLSYALEEYIYVV
jgi:hypothetical protein